MKIKKLLALLVALTLAMTVIPGFGLVASAAITKGQGIVTTSGEAYAASSDDLLTDGSFETDAWAKALTTGAYVDAGGGNPGKKATIEMNTDPVMAQYNATAFKQVEGRNGGKAISPAFYAFTPNQSVKRYTNDENGPTSIKHYIQNTSNSVKTYYTSFWVKDLLGDEPTNQLKYFIGEIGEDARISSSTAVFLNDLSVDADGWAHIDVISKVKGGNYLLVNVFYMGENAVALDDFEICEVSDSPESKEFGKAMNAWHELFPYTSGQIITSDLVLPTKAVKADVKWTSSNESLINPETGEVGLVRDATQVTLTAVLSYQSLSYTYTYVFTVEGFLDRIKSAITSGKLVNRYVGGEAETIELPDTIADFEGSKVTWASSNENIINPNGAYNPPLQAEKVTLTATVEYAGETIVQSIDVYAGKFIKDSLIPNGSFEVIDGTTIPEWTNGAVQPMTTTNFDYVAEENGNHYIVSKTHEDANGAGSIKAYFDLEPGKFYDLSFKLWYYGAEKCQECYTAALLVEGPGTTINDDGSGNFAPVNTYGGFPFPKASYNGKWSKADGWNTVNVGLLKPDQKYHTLCITSRWLNKTDGGLSDGRWAFDDFVLKEIVSDFTEDVTINFLDADSGEAIKTPQVLKAQYGNINCYAPDESKADFTIRNSRATYRYVPEMSTDYVFVTKGVKNEINLYFRKLISADVILHFVDRESGAELAASYTDKDGGYVGYDYEVDPSVAPYTITKKGGTHYGLDESSVSGLKVSENDEDNEFEIYYDEVKTNLITNGSFATGNTDGWTNRIEGTITDGTVALDSELGVNALTISTKGREATNSIGTVWPVQKGVEYILSFDVGGTKPSTDNYTYNRVTDDRYHEGGSKGWDNSGNDIITYGKDMVSGKWNHMEKKFVAQTDMVYFQSGWASTIKFTNFLLRPAAGKIESGSVKINFLDKADSTSIKDAVTFDNLVAGSTYSVPAQYLVDIDSEKGHYRYRSDNVSSTTVKANTTTDINLYFDKITTATVHGKLAVKDTGEEIFGDGFTAEAEVGKAFEVPSAYTGARVGSDGKSYMYDGSDPETLIVDTDESKNNITLYYVEANSLIKNGDFETPLDGENIPEWGTGTGTANDVGVAQLTTANFDYVTDEADGNHYIQSKSSNQLYTAGSLKRFVNLTPGKAYKFSFKVKRAGGEKRTEAWIEAVLVKDDHVEIGENNTDHNTVEQYRKKYGSFIPEPAAKGGADMSELLIGPEDGWVTIERTLTPDNEFKTLLIGAKWLDNNWCFDDFVLTEIGDAVQPNTIAIEDDKATITANSDMTGQAIVALYDADNKLVSVKLETLNLSAGQSADVSIDYNVEGAVTVKVFAMNINNGVAPLAESAEGTVPGTEPEKLKIVAVEATQEKEADKGNVKENVMDGSYDTKWTCEGEGSITVDVGEVKSLRRIAVYLDKKGYTDGRTLPIKVSVSEDNEAWTEVQNTTYGPSNEYTGIIDVNNNARYVRVSVSGNSISNWASVTEIEVYA